MLELSWGCDNVIQMIENTSILKPCQANRTKPAKTNQTKFKVAFQGLTSKPFQHQG